MVSDDIQAVLDALDDEVFTSPEDWTQGMFVRRKPLGNDYSRCLLGGVKYVVYGGFGRSPYQGSTDPRYLVTRTCERLAKHFPTPHYEIVPFNDDPRTTFEDVKRVIKQAR